ncbi:MAG: penicillin-binding protein 2 [Clostridia bacterium]|nr:penicillin-binding protein 2 [Clostridia bacterium]
MSLKILKLDIFENRNYTNIIHTQSKATKIIAPVRNMICDRNMIPLTNRNTSIRYLNPDGQISSNHGIPFDFPQRHGKDRVAMHLVGYTSSDGTGLCGIEKKYNEILKTDKNVKISYTADGAGNPLKDSRLITDSQTESKTALRLTIDYHIQKITEKALNDFIPKGAAVVLDVNSFDVLAMASNPQYDSNEKYTTADNGQLLNRALCAYNAGSIFKIVTASAALESDFRYIDKTFWCSGKFTGDGVHIFECNKSEGHMQQSFTSAFANSCNCAFYETGLLIGAHKLINTAHNFGLGSQCVDMGNEEACGNIPKKDVYTANEAINLSIGQGEIMITPIQCAAMCATVANGGIRKKTNVVCGEVNMVGGSESSLRSDCSYPVISAATASAIGAMMRECVLFGTASEAASSPFKIAGKTGSAESGWQTESGEMAVHGWFCGFFPYDNPRYALAIVCENGRSGAQSCIKPFIKICEEINKIYPFIQ